METKTVSTHQISMSLFDPRGPRYPSRRETISPQQMSVSRIQVWSGLVWCGQMKSSVHSIVHTLYGYQAKDRLLTSCMVAQHIQSWRLAPWQPLKWNSARKLSSQLLGMI